MKILFIGSVEFSEHLLRFLLDSKIGIEAIICRKPNLINSDFADLTKIAIENKIEYKIVNNINHINNINWIKNLEPDLILCMGWSSLLSDEILKIPKICTIGFHPSLLPKNRGRHPIIWSLFLNLKKTGSTFFIMNSKADEGDIISQKEIDIEFKDNANTLYNKIINTAKRQLVDVINNFQMGKIELVKQNINSGNIWRKRIPKDGVIDFRMNSLSIYNLVRALSNPYVGAEFNFKDESIKVWDSEIYIYENINDEPGKILNYSNNNLLVKTYDSAILLKSINYDFKPFIGDYII